MFELFEEDTLASQEDKMKKLEIQNASLKKETELLLELLNISEPELETYFTTQGDFTDEEFAELQLARKEMDANLERTIAQTRDPKAEEKKALERNLPPHALFVK